MYRLLRTNEAAESFARVRKSMQPVTNQGKSEVFFDKIVVPSQNVLRHCLWTKELRVEKGSLDAVIALVFEQPPSFD